MTWLKLNRKSKCPESTPRSRLWTPVLLMNPSTPDEPQHPHSLRHSCLPRPREFPSSAHCCLFPCSALNEKKKKTQKRVTLLHVLTPFCHSCLHAGEICFWLGGRKFANRQPRERWLWRGLEWCIWPGSGGGGHCSLGRTVSSVASVQIKVTLFSVPVFINSFYKGLCTQESECIKHTRIVV